MKIVNPYLVALAEVESDTRNCPHGYRPTIRCGACERDARDLVFQRGLIRALEHLADVLDRLERR